MLVDRNVALVHENLAVLIEKKEIKFIINIYGKEYDCIHYPKNRAVYLFEVTEREELKVRYRDHIAAIGIISLDNFEEATQNFDYQLKSSIQGKFLGAIATWAKKYNVYLVNVRAEKSLLFMNRLQLDQIMKDEFTLLERITEVSNETEVRVTISIGVACSDSSQLEIGQLADDALQLALGRGGDQAVVNIENEPLKFFGGKTNTIEKTDEDYSANQLADHRRFDSQNIPKRTSCRISLPTLMRWVPQSDCSILPWFKARMPASFSTSIKSIKHARKLSTC
ncbi:MAG: hypothetical protein MZU97_23180 [Bacillus subtilis]|nr:hypothetical protein [Bacillus subtilis]